MTPFYQRYIEDRLFEWAMAVGTIGLAFEMFLWPRVIETSAFRWITFTIPADILAIAVAVIGPIRLIALIVDDRGFGLVGSMSRFVTSMLSCVLWSQYTYALHLLGMQNGVPSPGTPFWAAFTVAEMCVCYRAIRDARRAY